MVTKPPAKNEPAVTENGKESEPRAAIEESVDISALLDPASYKLKLVQLPSKRWVEIQPLSLMNLVRSGKIPNPLLATVYRMIEGKDPEVFEDDEDEEGEDEEGEDGEGRKKKRTPEQLHNDYYAALDIIVLAAVRRPVMVANESDEDAKSVWVGHMIDVDKSAVYSFVVSTVEYLNSFRDRLAGSHP